MVIAKGLSNGDSRGGGTLRSRFLSLRAEEEEEEGGGRVLVLSLPRGTEKGSGPWLFRKGWGCAAGAQASCCGSASASWWAGGSNAARKGSSCGRCLQFHTVASTSGSACERKIGGKQKALPPPPPLSTSGGTQGECPGPPHAHTSSGVRGGRAGEGSRKADRKGSGGRRRDDASLVDGAAVGGGHAAQPLGSGDGPRG
ncbi:hypothetical protein AALO_G00132270 [Alosa alosa]|uniref:Uncharacterized protein n=1 Tax=Alosa alosa TaxID=278164 RepID=A0AAV6GSB9_9TELE|nr:hypothetical protein AALO_G00132270 [Alosa alosa]